MPNHCANILRVSGAAAALAAFRAYAKGDGPPWDGEAREQGNDLDLHKFVPVPEEVLNAKKSNNSDAFNSGGYDWVVANWGTKWGCYDIEVTEEPGMLQYRYQTAWAPFNENVLLAMSEKFPTLKFEMKYAEQGCGFCGIVTAEGGDLVDNNYYEEKAYQRKLKADDELEMLAGQSG